MSVDRIIYEISSTVDRVGYIVLVRSERETFSSENGEVWSVVLETLEDRGYDIRLIPDSEFTAESPSLMEYLGLERMESYWEGYLQSKYIIRGRL
jgi:hypothetical protein